MTEPYPFQRIEPKWQRFWEERQLFRAVDHDSTRPKCTVLVQLLQATVIQIYLGFMTTAALIRFYLDAQSATAPAQAPQI